MSKNKKMVTVIILLLIFAALFGGCRNEKDMEQILDEAYESIEEPKIDRIEDEPMLVYTKYEGRDENGRLTSVYVYQYSSEPKVVFASGEVVHEISTEEVAFIKKENHVTKEDGLFVFDGSAETKILLNDVFGFTISEDGRKIANYYLQKSDDYDMEWCDIIEYDENWEVGRRNTILANRFWSITFNRDMYFYEVKGTFFKDFEFNWKDMYYSLDGEDYLIARDGTFGWYGQAFAENSTVLYIAEGDKATQTGNLYKKELGAEPIKIITDCTQDFAISKDAGLIAAKVIGENYEDTLFYQFEGEKSVQVEKLVQFKISPDGNTLFYTIETGVDWVYELYKVTLGCEPMLIDDNVTLIVESSDDGSCIAYISNVGNVSGENVADLGFTLDSSYGDLFIARNGQGIEFIDSNAYFTGSTGFLYSDTINMSNNGDYIAYLRVDQNGEFSGELNIKKKGEEPKKIDEQVVSEFAFVK